MNIHDPSHHQANLFELFADHDFKTPASARTHYGKAMEELVCAAMGLTNIPINGNYEINFDAKQGAAFFEIKSVRDLPSSKSVIYDWRIAKEKPHALKLHYIFGLHQVKAARSNADLWDQLEAGGVRLIVTPAARVHRLALEQPLNKIKTERLDAAKPRDGYSRKGYCEGYRNLPVGAISAGRSPLSMKTISVRIYDRKIPVKIIHI